MSDSDFDSKYGKYVNTLEDPGLNVTQQLVMTAGKSAGAYKIPTTAMEKTTLNLFEALAFFDTHPTDATFAGVKQALAELQMKAVRVSGSKEWLYITPDADPKKEESKWNRIALNTQFNLSWHVGSASKVGISDEHNGSDGAYRVVGELVKQGSNLKLVMSNSLHRECSGQDRKKGANWAHSKNTIDYPVMEFLAKLNFAIINIHGWASTKCGLLVNNRTSNFTKSRASLPTMIGIALAQYFRDPNDHEFEFGGVLPGNIVVNGSKVALSPSEDKPKASALFERRTGVHNTNVIGNLIHNVQAQQNGEDPYKYDSGNSCHIEFGAVRKGGPNARKFVAAINEAAYWMNNYKPELNPWVIVKGNPNFDMTYYGTLFPPNAELEAQLKQAANNMADLDSARIVAPEKDELDSEEDDQHSALEVQAKPLILSGGKLKDEQEKEVEKEDQATTPSTRRVKQKA